MVERGDCTVGSNALQPMGVLLFGVYFSQAVYSVKESVTA